MEDNFASKVFLKLKNVWNLLYLSDKVNKTSMANDVMNMLSGMLEWIQEIDLLTDFIPKEDLASSVLLSKISLIHMPEWPGYKKTGEKYIIVFEYKCYGRVLQISRT